MTKLRPDGSRSYEWDGHVLASDAEGLVLRAPFNVPLVELGFTTFRKGDVFVEFYYWDHWYNVYQVFERDGTLKGWYANLGAPAVMDGPGQLSYVDLALDVWVNPDGSHQVLDEDELAELMPNLTPVLRAGAVRGRTELVALAESQRMPDWRRLSSSASH